MKANDNLQDENVLLPLPPLNSEAKLEMDVYARFMRHLRHVPNSRMEIKVLSTIQFVADIMDLQDHEVATALVDMGLKAPRMAFPANYLEVADNALMREDWEAGAASIQVRDLSRHWGKIGEDRFAGFNSNYPTLVKDLFTRA